MTPSITFTYTAPHTLNINMRMVRATLREVQAQLLSHSINGGTKKLDMNTITSTNNLRHSCKMAACIGGWTSLFLLGFDKTMNAGLESPADDLFSELVKLDNAHGNEKLYELFYSYGNTANYNEPNVAATAIGRYLRGRDPWPSGEMPNVLPYTKRASTNKRK